MRTITLRRLLLCIAAPLLLLVAACGSLLNEKVESVDHRLVQYALNNRATAAPAVIFESGLDGQMYWWQKVLPEVSKDATTFAYNRPGYGKSEPVSSPRDGQHVVDELRSLLRSNGLKPPYVLVGHSLGGLYMQLFARRYPDEVAALVLVDSTHPSQFKDKGDMQNWPAWARTGFRMYLSSTAKDELDSINATGEAVLALPTFSGKPVIVLSALKPMDDKSELADDANAKRKEIAQLYPGSKQVWVDSGHGIPMDRPDAVIAAIREVLPQTEPARQ